MVTSRVAQALKLSTPYHRLPQWVLVWVLVVVVLGGFKVVGLVGAQLGWTDAQAECSGCLCGPLMVTVRGTLWEKYCAG